VVLAVPAEVADKVDTARQLLKAFSTARRGPETAAQADLVALAGKVELAAQAVAGERLR
jgi:hypothetical protein